MAKNYDNWERLVTAVVRRERDKQIALTHSRDPSSISSSSSSSFDLNFSTTSQFDHDHSPVLREGSELLMDYSDLTLLDHREWKIIIPTDKQESAWRTLNRSFFLDQTTGKNCFLLGVTFLKIKVYGVFDKFSTKFHLKSRFREVAEIIYTSMIDIQGTIQTKMMSPFTLYSAYLVFGFIENYPEPHKAYASITILCDQHEDNSRKRSQLVYFRGKGRADGWMEIHLGKFYVGRDNGEIQVKLVDLDVPWKSGLTVEGIEFRPSE